jgi:hypothetical protein
MIGPLFVGPALTAFVCEPSLQALQMCKKFVVVPGEFRHSGGELAVGYDRRFVIWTEARRNGREAFLHLFRLLLLQIVIDQHDRGKGGGIRGEPQDFLLDPVGKNPELVLLQVANQAALAVLHRHRNDHLVGDHDDRTLRRGRCLARALTAILSGNRRSRRLLPR